MISINGLDKFRDFFSGFHANYVLIGGTACAVIFHEIGEKFRSTKDLDVVLIVENLNEEFGNKFWEFIKSAEYVIEADREKRCFYRFKNPGNNEYPKMIELFSRSQNLVLPENVHTTPIHIADEISSLSAILLNDDYYQFMIEGKRIIDGISVLDEEHLIPFKAKAWCELIDRRTEGEQGQSKHIRKHCRDINNLVPLIPSNEIVKLSGMVKRDMERFIQDILTSEYVPDDINRETLYKSLRKIYL